MGPWAPVYRGGGTLVSTRGAWVRCGEVVGVGVSLPRESLREVIGVPGERDLGDRERDLRGEEVGVPGERGGVDVGVCGDDCLCVAWSGILGDPLLWLALLSEKLRLGGSTLVPGAAL